MSRGGFEPPTQGTEAWNNRKKSNLPCTILESAAYWSPVGPAHVISRKARWGALGDSARFTPRHPTRKNSHSPWPLGRNSGQGGGAYSFGVLNPGCKVLGRWRQGEKKVQDQYFNSAVCAFSKLYVQFSKYTAFCKHKNKNTPPSRGLTKQCFFSVFNCPP